MTDTLVAEPTGKVVAQAPLSPVAQLERMLAEQRRDRLPYPGLRAFNRDEADLFFGRESCIDVMLDRLAATRFLAVLGASGSGKSSLVRSGLLEQLRLGQHPKVGARWKVAEMTPGAEPMARLADAVLRSVADENPGGPSRPSARTRSALETMLLRGPRSLLQWAEAKVPPQWNLLIIVDQFEELFRYRDFAAREQRDAFVAQLLETAKASDGRISIVITMRSEYLGACSLLPGLSRRIGEGLYLTARMTSEECRQAIEGPARVMGFEFEPALVDRMIQDLALKAPWERAQTDDEADQLAREADQLPLLQHTLNRLWQRVRRRAGDGPVRITGRDYQRIGGISGAFNQHGKQVIGGLTRGRPELEPVIERTFRALVAGPSLALAVRRPLTIEELMKETAASPADIERILRAFTAADCNFLRVTKADGARNHALVDISHESLIRQWSTLSQWFGQEETKTRNWLDLCRRAEPTEDGEPILLEGQPLMFFEGWWSLTTPTPNWAARYGGDFVRTEAYLRRSVEANAAKLARDHRAVEAERRRRLRRTQEFMLATVALTLMAAWAAWMWRDQREARADVNKEKSLRISLAYDYADTACSAGFKMPSESISQCKERMIGVLLYTKSKGVPQAKGTGVRLPSSPGGAKIPGVTQ